MTKTSTSQTLTETPEARAARRAEIARVLSADSGLPVSFYEASFAVLDVQIPQVTPPTPEQVALFQASFFTSRDEVA